MVINRKEKNQKDDETRKRKKSLKTNKKKQIVFNLKFKSMAERLVFLLEKWEEEKKKLLEKVKHAVLKEEPLVISYPEMNLFKIGFGHYIAPYNILLTQRRKNRTIITIDFPILKTNWVRNNDKIVNFPLLLIFIPELFKEVSYYYYFEGVFYIPKKKWEFLKLLEKEIPEFKVEKGNLITDLNVFLEKSANEKEFRRTIEYFVIIEWLSDEILVNSVFKEKEQKVLIGMIEKHIDIIEKALRLNIFSAETKQLLRKMKNQYKKAREIVNKYKVWDLIKKEIIKIL